MEPTPEELERADIASVGDGLDPDAVRELLRGAAARIRALERDGVKRVSESVSAVLEQAVRSGEELVAGATADAAAVREAADHDAARRAEEGEAAAAERIAEGERRATETVREAEERAGEIVAAAEEEARRRAKAVIDNAQSRLDGLLAAERDVHDRLQRTIGEVQTSLSRLGIRAVDDGPVGGASPHPETGPGDPGRASA